MKNKSLPWGISFILLFFLSMDFWTWENPIRLSLLNLPTWLYYFVTIQLLLTLAIYLFTKYYWKQ